VKKCFAWLPELDNKKRVTSFFHPILTLKVASAMYAEMFETALTRDTAKHRKLKLHIRHRPRRPKERRRGEF
jgi:hypothetical protein